MSFGGNTLPPKFGRTDRGGDWICPCEKHVMRGYRSRCECGEHRREEGTPTESYIHPLDPYQVIDEGTEVLDRGHTPWGGTSREWWRAVRDGGHDE